MVRRKETREWLRELADCNKVVTDEEIEEWQRISSSQEDVKSTDEVDETVEVEWQQSVLGAPTDTYSLTRIQPNLPECMNYGVLSGQTHMYSDKFSSFSRGFQGPAIAITAYATTGLLKAHTWNVTVIDQIVEDGDTYYCDSYKKYDNSTANRQYFTVTDLQRSLIIQNTHQVQLSIDDAAYTGVFRSRQPTEMHLIKALELFFRTHKAGILTSTSLNITIWREGRYFNIFDGQPRNENLLPDSRGNAKIIILHDIIGVIFVILERSNIHDEHFVLYPLEIGGIVPITDNVDLDDDEKMKILGSAERRPSGYKLQGVRALVRGTFHLMHSNVPDILQGRAHLIVSLVTLIYSKLIHANKWTTAIIDLIFNHAHIYFIELTRVLEMKIDDKFELSIDDLLSDIILGIYTAKVKIEMNIIPGQAKKGKGKGKSTLDTGLVEFFQDYQLGIIEIKKIFYAVWMDGDKYYFHDPFACDQEGYRVDIDDPDSMEKSKNAVACVTMNSTIDELMEIILENTGNTEKDPFILHGLRVLYVKTCDYDNNIIYRETRTNRRPLPAAAVASPVKIDEYKMKIIAIPTPRTDADRTKVQESQFPELIKDASDFMLKDEEFNSIKHLNDQLKAYKIVNSHRLILHGTKNCFADNFDESTRGRQGLSMALSAIAHGKLKHPRSWRNFDVNEVIDLGNEVHLSVIHGRDVEETVEDEDDDDDDDDDDDIKDDVEHVEGIPGEIHDNFMLPGKVKYGNDYINIKWKRSVVRGNAEPIVNLGEALDRYFQKYNELIFENNQLMYAIWKDNGYYFLFNPYGGDEEGWRLFDYPASLLIVDTLNELIDLLYGIVEFNERKFDIHFIYIKSIQPSRYNAPLDIELPTTVEYYQTTFLPLTDDDLLILQEVKEQKDFIINEDTKSNEDETTDDENAVETDEIAMKLEETEEKQEKDDLSRVPLTKIVEPDLPDAPSQLNLFLITTKINLEDETVDFHAKEAREYERLKYNHPPPFVHPPTTMLAQLLKAKKASKSIPSLVSCFSIDSKLAVKTDLAAETLDTPTINTMNNEENSKIIKLPPKKYLYSRLSPVGFTPLRAINEKFIHNEEYDEEREEECRRKKLKSSTGVYYHDEVPEIPDTVRISPEILPLGPIIRTPVPVARPKDCVETRELRCNLSNVERAKNPLLDKLVCKTEEILFEMIFPTMKDPDVDYSKIEEVREDSFDAVANKILAEEEIFDRDETIQVDGIKIEELKLPEPRGFISTENNISIIIGNMKLQMPDNIVPFHFNSSFFAAILIILAKTIIEITDFNDSILDMIILFSNKIYNRVGNLTYKAQRTFNNLELFDVKFNIILKQDTYADPENHEPDLLPNVILNFFNKHSSGILVFENALYAFWNVINRYYLFDPYSCNEYGRASDEGTACLMEFYAIDDFIERIDKYSRININKPYRIYTLFIAHIEPIVMKNKVSKKRQFNEEVSDEIKQLHEVKEEEEEEEDEEIKPIIAKPELSLIELSDWIKGAKRISLSTSNIILPGFSALKNVNASAQDVIVIENDITRPVLAPFKIDITKNTKTPIDLLRKKPYDRKFNEHSIVAEPLDLCIIAWSCIHDPTLWGARTIRGIYEASQDLTYDSLLAAEDTTVAGMTDGLLTNFDIANYRFSTVFAPIHIGKLYASEGWNLAMSLKKLFSTPMYTGAVLSCGKSHIGLLKCHENLYAWWCVVGEKKLKIVTTKDIEELLKLIITAIDEAEEIEFQMRAITISYARKLDPDCSDTKGLHELVAATSLPQIHRKDVAINDLKMIVRSDELRKKPIFIRANVGLEKRDEIKEPTLKRCYFVSLLAVMVKRDIMQSPLPSMIDKIIEVGENLYREFNVPKYHTEHILRNVTVMNRIFDFRDVASALYTFTKNSANSDDDDYVELLQRELNKFLKKHSHGILHFTNCCYGFWYSQATDAFYYLDPYQCNDREQVENEKNVDGGCLGIFPSINDMVKSMLLNRCDDTTGFFIHRIHVESINVVPLRKFEEDPMWIYLDYHWSASHAVNVKPKTRKRKKKRNFIDQLCDDDGANIRGELKKSTWNHYTIEIPNLIYSLWGTLGAYDYRFGQRGGKNQAAICTAVLAMQYLCHPSKWSAAILDSAVICGDYYYTDSLKSSIYRGFKYPNNFNLQPSFKVTPNNWTVEYGAKMCGMLYGGNGRTTLAATLELALNISSNNVIKCGKITLAVLWADDGYYIADPCWIGPPLFTKHCGAIYVLRCRNKYSLIYAITKILNTNQRIEFTVTPVEFDFKQEACVSSMDGKSKEGTKRKILLNPLESQPTAAAGPCVPVAGAIAVPDEDIYLEYRRNVALGIECGREFEEPTAPSPEPTLNVENARNMRISTNWHKNTGRSKSHKLPLNSIHHRASKCNKTGVMTRQIDERTSVSKLFATCDEYPRAVDFLDDDKYVKNSAKPLTRPKIKLEKSPSKPLDCLSPRKFILKRNKREYKKQIAEWADDSYKTYKHRLVASDGDDEEIN